MKRVIFLLLLGVVISSEVQAQTWLRRASNSSRQDGYAVLVEIIRFMAILMPQLLERLDERHLLYFLGLISVVCCGAMAVLVGIERKGRKK